MCRYYFGSINGKFWNGVQDSDDALDFGAVEIRDYGFYLCDCDTEEPTEGNYCRECFESYDDHMKAIQEEGIEDDQMWYERAGARYELIDLDIVLDKICQLEHQVGHLISSYTLNEDLEYEVKSECWDKMTRHEEKLLARLCLGRQIAAAIQKNGSCLFYAES